LEKENITKNQIENEVEKVDSNTSENINKESSGKVILANALDQLVLVAGSSLLLLLCDLILKAFGYMFIRDNGALVLAGGIIYFIANCIYNPIMQKSKLKGTIAQKILNIN
jgi:hypothetical protein